MSDTQPRTPPADPVSLITPDVIRQYQEDGIVYLPNALHPEWLLLIELGINRIMKSGSPNIQTFFKGLPGEFKDMVRHFDLTPEFQRLVYDSPIADMMKLLLQTENLWLLFDHVFVKEGGYCRKTPWHQDTPYWPTAGSQIGSMWITLDPLPKAECLEFVRGSHLGPIYDGFSPADAAEDVTIGFYGKDYPRLPDIEKERLADSKKWDIVSWDLTPGDVILLHPSVLHGGGHVEDGHRRRTLSLRFFGDDIVYATRPDTRPTVPLTPGLHWQLKPGDPLRSPYYPKVRPLPGFVTASYA